VSLPTAVGDRTPLAAPNEVDPFGLWQPAPAPPEKPAEAIAFGDLSGAEEEPQPAAIWRLDLSSGPAGRTDGEEELQLRADRLRAIQEGLDAANPRIDRLLERRAGVGLSFAVGEEGAEPLEEPEQTLAGILDALEAPAQGETSFGLREDLSNLAGKLTGGANWNALQQRLQGMVESVNRQLLHFAWVDTALDGHLAARTTVNWGGDMQTTWQNGLLPEQINAHQRSLELALQSRQANLRTILTVSQIAGKIALAVATPLGPLQALSLGWQFVHDVIMPLMKPNQ